MTFPALRDVTLDALNLVGRWLAQDDLTDAPSGPDAELVVLAGNAVIPSIDAACRLASDGRILLISGGIGHSTRFLYAAVAAHPHYRVIPCTGRPEAAILADIAHDFWQIPRARIVVEDRSTNCGENARFTLSVLAERGLDARSAIVVQDPTMQRRTMATFAREASPLSIRWLSHPGVIPQLINRGEGLAFADPAAGLWPPARYLSLLLGELPRLYDDANGYGPRGKGFIAHVDFPAEVLEAWALLRGDRQLRETLAARAPD